jgi:hypothetical protein
VRDALYGGSGGRDRLLLFCFSGGQDALYAASSGLVNLEMRV